jgi:predicted Holliday junction resolvase-like endonuclease
MINVITILIITFIVFNLIINIDYVFAVKRHSLHNSNSKDATQKTKQNIQCAIDTKCNNQSQQQQQKTKQNIQCAIDAKCSNYSTSNNVICKDRSVCLIQYEGPFQLANPY